jgi:hypothetical protein
MTYDVLSALVVISLMATVSLWRTSAHKPPKPKKKFRNALLYSKPITPKHQPPKTIGESIPSLVRKEDRLFFADFADFADVVNSWLADEHIGSSWRLQELPDTELTLQGFDHPDFGRRYAVFHNQVRLGLLEVSPKIRYRTENPDVRTNIELDMVRLLPFDTIVDFLNVIASHVTDPDQSSAESVLATQSIHVALTKVGWQTHQITGDAELDGTDWGELELQLNGSATYYLERREALPNSRAAA